MSRLDVISTGSGLMIDLAHEGAAREAVLAAPENAVEFAGVIVNPSAANHPINEADRLEIIVGFVNIRLEERASAEPAVAQMLFASIVDACPVLRRAGRSVKGYRTLPIL